MLEKEIKNAIDSKVDDLRKEFLSIFNKKISVMEENKQEMEKDGEK